MNAWCALAVLLAAAGVDPNDERFDRVVIVVRDGGVEARNPATGGRVEHLPRGTLLFDRSIEGERLEATELMSQTRVAVDRSAVLEAADAVEIITQRIEIRPTVDDYVDRATLYLVAGRSTDAIRDVDAALKLDADCARAYFVRSEARAELAASEPERAAELYRQAFADAATALKLNPDDPRAWCRRARRGLKADQAIADYGEALKRAPHYALAYNNRALLLAGVNREDEALADYDKALQLAPKCADALANRALLHMRRDDVKAALRDAEAATKADSSSAKAWSARGEIELRIGLFDEAIIDFQQLQHYDAAAGVNGLCRASMVAHRYGDAMEYGRQWLRIDADDPQVHALLGDAYYQRGLYRSSVASYNDSLKSFRKVLAASDPEADARLERILELDESAASAEPPTPAFRHLASLFASRGAARLRQSLRRGGEADRQAGFDDMKRARRCDPKSETPYYYEARFLRESGDAKAADALIDAAVKIVDDRRSLCNNYAWFLATNPAENVRDGAAAVRYAEAACGRTDWREYMALDTLAAALAEAGEFEAAAERQQEAVKRWPGNGENAALNERLELYRQGQPYRESPVN